jgi:sigma-B regulation protein RsbU (phosphoserine phosphatase)
MEAAKILVVDYQEPDLELLIRQTFRKQILSSKLEFIFAHNGNDALAYLKKDPKIGIVLTDIKQHDGKGEDLLTHLAQIKRLIKTVVVTPYGDIESIRTAMNKGAFDFVTRPINLHELEQTIVKTLQQLEKSRAQEEVQNKLIDMEKELDVAKSIQTSILPHDFNPLPQHRTFEIFGTMLSAKGVGGDFFDFFPIDPDHLAFTIADVSGKGVPAALFMTMSRGLIRALGQKTRSPLQCFEQLNELINLENESSMFVTAFYAIFDVQTGVITYCNAGHNPPYLISPDGTLTQIGRCEGIALGVSKSDSFFQQKELKLNPGDILLLYTDGVTEAMNPQGALFGEERLEKTLRDNRQKPLKELLESVLASVKQFAGEREQSDDITLFGIKFKKEAY